MTDLDNTTLDNTTLDNIALVTFDEPSKAYQGLSRLKDLNAEGRFDVRSAAVVERDTSGQLHIREEYDNETGMATAGGGLIGMLIGVIGGPLGMLLGATSGALVGGAFDLDRSLTSDEVLARVNQLIPAGSTVLLAEVVEPAEQVLDVAAAELGGTVFRRPTEDVVAEMEAAEAAAEAAQAEARRTLHAQKRAERKADLQQRKAALHDKLHRHDTAAPAGIG